MSFLLFSLFFSCCIFFTFRYFNSFKINILPAVTLNYCLSFLFGFFSKAEDTSLCQMYYQPWFLMAVFTGMSFILTFMVFAYSTQLVGVAMTVVSSKMSIVLSVAVGFILLAEPFGLLKVVGIVAALFAFLMTNQVKVGRKVEKKHFYLPVLIFIGTGVNDSLMKLSGVYFVHRDEIQYLTITFLTAFSIGCIILFYRFWKKTIQFTWKDCVAGLLLGFLNWFSTYFFIKGLYVLPISLFVPVFNAAIVAIAAVSGYFFFNEKLSLLNRIGIMLAMAAIAVIAFS